MDFFSFLALLIVGLAAGICQITIIVQSFAHDEPGWGVALIVFGGCTPLVLWYGWSRAEQWGTRLLMIAYTISIIAYLGFFVFFFAPLILVILSIGAGR